MKMRLIRHATLWVEYGGLRIVVDPMLAETGANPPIPGTPNARANPLVPLPVPAAALREADLVIVTHLHPDHWDAAAAATFDPAVPILCQPGDETALQAQGFNRVTAVADAAERQGIRIFRTGGRHGTGEIGQRMGQVSGFVLQAAGEPTLYLAGDTVHCAEVEDALARYRPDWTVLNAGGARFLAGDPITMTPDDVASVCLALPDTARVAAVHMESINHCVVGRVELRRELEAQGLAGQVLIPADGEWLPC